MNPGLAIRTVELICKPDGHLLTSVRMNTSTVTVRFPTFNSSRESERSTNIQSEFVHVAGIVEI